MNKITDTLFCIGLAATIYYNGLNNSTAKLIAMLCFAILFLISISKKNPFTNRIFLPLWLWYFLGCLSNTFFRFAMGHYGLDYLNMEILMPLMVAYSSYTLLEFNDKSIISFFLPLCLFSSWCAIQSVLQGVGSFSIFENDNPDLVKNQIGAAFAVVSIACIVIAVEHHNTWLKLIYTILSVLNLYPAIFLSCRTAQVSFVLVVIFLLFKKYRLKAFIIVPLTILALVFIGGENLQNLLIESFVGNRDVTDVDDLSSGRVSRLSDSFNYFLDHPLFGFYGSGDNIMEMPENAHMFILFRLTKWGIIGSIPFIALYFTFFKIFIKSIRMNNMMVAGILLLAYIESFAEYTPPFGPGSSFIFMFVLIGVFLKKCNPISRY